MKCSEIMTPDPVLCIPSDPVSMAARLMRDHDIGSIPVTNDRKSRRLVGIVTDRDIALSIVAEERDPGGTVVGDVMTPDPITCRPGDDIESVMNTMKRSQLRRIPVTDGSGELVGMVAQADLAVHCRDADKTADVLAAVSRPA
jgi:CBS domain-containing protein